MSLILVVTTGVVYTAVTTFCSVHGLQVVETGPKPTAPLVLRKGERIPIVTDGPFGSSRRQRATRIRVRDSNRVRIQNCMTQVKQQWLWLKAKLYFTTVIYKFTHIKVKVSSLAKLHSHVKVLKFCTTSCLAFI